MGFHFDDTCVARNLDVATVKDDHCPVVAELSWQPLPPCCPANWHSPIVARASLKEVEAAGHFRQWLSLVPVPPEGTPVDAHQALVATVLQHAGTLFFPPSVKKLKRGVKGARSGKNGERVPRPAGTKRLGEEREQHTFPSGNDHREQDGNGTGNYWKLKTT